VSNDWLCIVHYAQLSPVFLPLPPTLYRPLLWLFPNLPGRRESLSSFRGQLDCWASRSSGLSVIFGFYDGSCPSKILSFGLGALYPFSRIPLFSFPGSSFANMPPLDTASVPGLKPSIPWVLFLLIVRPSRSSIYLPFPFLTLNRLDRLVAAVLCLILCSTEVDYPRP